MLDVGIKCMKVTFLLFNSIFLLAGIALIGSGAFVYSELLHYGSLVEPTFKTVPLLLIGIWAINASKACLGFYGICAENRKVVIVYGLLLLITFILEVAAGLVGIVLSPKAKTLLSKHLHTTMNDTAGWNFLQEKFDCCGVSGPNDWLEFYRARDNNAVTNSTDTNSTDINLLPYTCCASISYECSATTIYSRGCFYEFYSFLDDEVYTLGLVGLTLTCVKLVGIILAFYVAKGLKEEYEAIK